jgi:hypothetical protein
MGIHSLLSDGIHFDVVHHPRQLLHLLLLGGEFAKGWKRQGAVVSVAFSLHN